MKRLIYQVSIGKPSKLYDTCVDSVSRYCEKNNIDHIVQTTPKLRIKPDIFSTNRSPESYGKYGGFLPIYEKENAFDLLDKYREREEFAGEEIVGRYSPQNHPSH